ncbi:hypothetical protein ACFL35_21090 [Candidatus Riflebacteria bacterium]
MKFKTLYHKDKKGKIRSWRVWTDRGKIHTEHGLLDGKKQISTVIAKPKNVGRANATTAEEQADKEAAALHLYKLERKYALSPEAAETPSEGVMLAHEYQKKIKKVSYPLDISPKLDGIRFSTRLTEKALNVPVITSRSGKVFEHMMHIQTELSSVMSNNMMLDGEGYIHGLEFRLISRLIKKYRPGESEAVKYYIFDLVDMENRNLVWEERKENLATFFKDREFNHLVYVPSYRCESLKDLHKYEDQFVDDGYEGAIIRLYGGKYEFGHRSDHLLKFKRYEDAEFKIIGHKFGKGKCAKCVIWVCETKESYIFDVMPKGTMEEREKWGSKAKEYYGKYLKVKYKSFSSKGIPREPIGLGIREEFDR